MQFLKRLFDFYLNSSIHVALAVCSLTWITLVDFNSGVDLNIIYFIFLATISGYNFVKYFVSSSVPEYPKDRRYPAHPKHQQ